MSNTSNEPPLHSHTHHVIGIVDTPEQVAATLRSLADSGFPDDAAEVLCGEAGLRHIDSSGEHHGLDGRMMRITERLFADDHELIGAEQALQAGKFVVAVLATADEAAERARAALRSNGAHGVVRYGRWTTTHLHP